MNRRMLSILLLICMVVTMLPAGAIAAAPSAQLDSLERAYGDSYIAPEETGEPLTYARKTESAMEASQELIDFIKASEGFSRYAIWDYEQYSIGYGSRCDPNDYPDGITEEEAEVLLRDFVDDWVVVVNSYIDRHDLTKTQYEFDALVCFCYGVGNAWMYGDYNIRRYTIEGCTELQFVNCIGAWVSAGGQALNGLIYRRMREANIYCNGDYSKTDNLYDDVPYGCVTFDANGGSVSMSRIYTIRGQSYRAYDAFPEPARDGYYFAGWYDEDGEQFTSDTICSTVLTELEAKWSTDPDDYFNEDGHEPPAPPPVEIVAGFTDVTVNDWFAEYVEQAVTLGLFNGVTETQFKPQNTMTRAMFVQVIYRMYGQPEISGTLPFTDVPSGAWYYNALLWAYEAGIVNGVSADRFAPNADVTRQQMAKMLYQYCSLCGNADLESLRPLDSFADAAEVAEYAKIPLQWAVGNGIITGVNATTLAPTKNTTRAQAATMLVRYTETFNRGVSAASQE